MTGYIWNMKRRNIDCSKLRRPAKKSRLSEGLYGSVFLYAKFLLVWALVLAADFLLEFRFEYLWPLWLLIRSTIDSFRYQGLAFSVLFVCISVTSDVVCYLFVPVQWIFFAASTYVWVQYVWHTDRGICIPTISLWLLFVYIESAFRLRDYKCLPFHIDLCRPFAAHCIGYPVVTLGIGFKSYVSYKLRLRKQKEIKKENQFYMELLQQALPADEPTVSMLSQEDAISSVSTNIGSISAPVPSESNKKIVNGKANADVDSCCGQSNGLVNSDENCFEFIDNSLSSSLPPNVTTPSKHFTNNVNNYKEENSSNDVNHKVFKPMAAKNNVAAAALSTKKSKTNLYANSKDDVISRLESDIKRVRSELQSSRITEQELRCQINNLITTDRTTKSEVSQLRQDNDSLQSKLHNLVTSRQQDKQALLTLERKLQDERKQRSTLEQQLIVERKKKSEENTRSATPVAKSECNEVCKSQRSELECEVKQLCWDVKRRDDQIHQLERDTQMLRQYKESQSESEVLMSALIAMREKNAHLETSLSSETRLKMDLFSALGDAKRQIEIQHGLLLQKEGEIADLKTKVAEVMALVPAAGFGGLCTDSPPHFSAAFTSSNLNPNASDYQPKHP